MGEEEERRLAYVGLLVPRRNSYDACAIFNDFFTGKTQNYRVSHDLQENLMTASAGKKKAQRWDRHS